MNFKDYRAYFSMEYRGISKYGACLHIFPKTVFTKEDYVAISKAETSWYKDYPLYTNTEQSAEYVKIFVSFSDCAESSCEDILLKFCNALDKVRGIKHIIINDGSETDEEKQIKKRILAEIFAKSGIPVPKETECVKPDIEEFDWDSSLGLKKLSLNYPVHAEGIEGECFTYSVYFETEVGEQERKTVVNAINTYDFKLSGDDYIGYTDVKATNGRVEIYLDLGNTQPQNENKIIHGILFALNNVQGVKNVIVNEGCGEY